MPRVCVDAKLAGLGQAFTGDDDVSAWGQPAQLSCCFRFVHGPCLGSSDQFGCFLSSGSETTNFPDAFDSCHRFSAPELVW